MPDRAFRIREGRTIMQVGVSFKWFCTTELNQNAYPFATSVTSQLKHFFFCDSADSKEKSEGKPGPFSSLKSY